MNDISPEMASRMRRMLLARSRAERLTMGSQMFDVPRTTVPASPHAGLSRRQDGRFFTHHISQPCQGKGATRFSANRPAGRRIAPAGKYPARQ